MLEAKNTAVKAIFIKNLFISRMNANHPSPIAGEELRYISHVKAVATKLIKNVFLIPMKTIAKPARKDPITSERLLRNVFMNTSPLIFPW